MAKTAHIWTMKEVIYIKPGYIQLFFKALYERLMRPHRDNSLLLKNIRDIISDELRRYKEVLPKDNTKAAQEAAHIIATKYAGAMENLAKK